MKKILSVLIILCMLMGIVTFSVSAEETNFVPEDVSGFETGNNQWKTLAGGNVKITDNPTGTGKVLCYSAIPDKSYATPQIDIRSFIQDNVKEPTKIYGSFDMYSVAADILDVIIRIRTKTEDGFSKCKVDGKNYCTIGKATCLEGEWTRISFSFDVTASDLASTEEWNLCFDGLSKMTKDKIYLDNLYLGLEEECDIPENEDMGNADNVGSSSSDESESFINYTFDEGVGTWKILGAGEVSVTDNPAGEGKVLKYTLSENAKNFHSPQIDTRPIILKNVAEERTVYGSIDVYTESEISSLLLRLRTQTPNGYSLCESEGKNYCTISSSSVPQGKWTTISFSIEITEDDLKSKENWNFCFDGLASGNSSVTAYFDNFYLGLEEPEEKEVIKAEIPEKTPVTRQENTLVGTIRWDAFTESTPDGIDPASQVARVLSPKKYHGQAPFFSTVNDDGTISFPEYTVETWEKEAKYAVEGGLDYFAYLWYDTGAAMSEPRKLHLQSEKKDTIKMCGILEALRPESTMNELFEAMKDSCYLTLDGRPVVFLYGLNDNDNWNDKTIKKLRQDAANAGIEKSLYVVGMFFSKHLLVFNENIQKDIDAVSWYSVGATETGQPYQSLATDCEETMKTIGGFTLGNNKDIIPSFTAGRDTRARIETGVSWVDGDPNATDDLLKPYKNKYSLLPTMEELENHMFNVIAYAQNSPNAMTNIVCSYGWNEHEEGGWLCPTITVDAEGNPVYNEDGTIKANTERLDALKRAIDRVRSGDSAVPSASPEATPNGGDNTNEGGFNILFVIIPVAAAIVIAGVIVTVLVIKKKKANKTEE